MAGELYQVDMNETKIVQHPDKIVTIGASSCMAVGILNHRSRRGYLGHYLSRVISSEALVDKAISEATNIGDLEVALAGNIPESRADVEAYHENFEESLEMCLAHARWALQMIQSKGITSKRIQNYLQDYPSEDSYDMIVDTEQRRIEVRKDESFIG